MIHVDIAAKIVSPETSIWVVFPGRGRKFINVFLSHDAIFLETPGIQLSPTTAGDKLLLRQHTRMSIAIAEFIRTDKKTVPSRNARTYSDAVFNDRGQQMLASSVRKMFGSMKSGDLVIVPGRMFEPVYFGEVISDFAAKDVVNVERYHNEDIPFRRVRWLNAGVERHLIPSSLQIFISKPPAIARVQRSFQTEVFFKLAYPAFVLADKSAVMMDGPKYDGKDPLATYEASLLVSYFVSAFNAIEKEQLDQFAQLDVHNAVKKYYNRDLVESFSQNFNSPGKFGLSALSAVLAAFVSGGIAISLHHFSVADLKGGIEVTNSISPTDAHIAKDSGVKLEFLFNALHKKEIDEIASLAEQAKKNIGLTTPVQVEKSEP